ncbi:MAG: hypothetical protein ACO3BX_03745, partial [Candidatus Limnocylindrus sp.]
MSGRAAPAARITRAAARRFLAERHMLLPPRSLPAGRGSVLALVERLGSLQFDPVDLAGRSHEIVCHARIDGFEPRWRGLWLANSSAMAAPLSRSN